MTYEKIIKEIAFNKELNPFHDDFSYDRLQNIITKIIDIDVKEDVYKCLSIIFFILLKNPEYNEYYNQINTFFLDRDKISDFYLKSIIQANHNCITIKIKVEEKLKESEKFEFLSMNNLKVDTVLGVENPFDLAEQAINLLDFNFNMIKFCSKEHILLRKESNRENDKEFAVFSYWNNYFDIYRNVFNRLCFENSEVEIDNDKKTIVIKSGERNLNFYKVVSNNRIYMNLSKMQIDIRKSQQLQRLINIRCNFNNFVISQILGAGNKIKIKYEKVEKNDKLEELYLGFEVVFIGYHFHLNIEKKDKLAEIGIVYTALKHLVIEIEEKILKGNYNDDKDYQNIIQFRFKKGFIVQFIKKITGMKEYKILKILDILENDGNKSFWTNPILNYKDEYFLIYFVIKNGNYLNFIDEWESVLFPDDDSKGIEFEKYLREEINNQCKKRGFQSYIPEQKKFKFNNKFEEVDLIWETSETVMIAEVKCIKYPFESRNINHYLKVIEKATDQIKRKVKYLLNNKEDIKDINFNKDIVSCVITNYPFVTGAVINDVPIIDQAFFTSYIGIGYNAKYILNKDHDEIVEKNIFYNDEKEFSERIKNNIYNPRVFTDVAKYFKKELREVNIVEDYKLFMEDIINTEEQLKEFDR